MTEGGNWLVELLLVIAVTLKEARRRASIIGPPMFPEPDKEVRDRFMGELNIRPSCGTYSYYGNILDCWYRHDLLIGSGNDVAATLLHR